MRRCKALIVEDIPVVRELAVRLFEELGFEILDTYSATNALDLLAENPDVDVLFADIRMPGPLDGLDLADTVERLYPHICVVLTSGEVIPPGAGRGFVPKPWRRERIEAAITCRPGTRGRDASPR